MKICKISGCSSRVKCKGLCNRHYQRNRLGKPIEPKVKYERHGFGDHPLSRMRQNMLSRCKRHPTYVKNGIGVCDEWINNPESFCLWGIDNGWFEGASIDRINPKDDYRPDNCRFLTVSENSKRAYRYTRKYELNGTEYSIKELAEISGLKPGTIWARINRYGFSVEKACFDVKSKIGD